MSAPLYKRIIVDSASLYGFIVRKSAWIASPLLQWPNFAQRKTVLSGRHQVALNRTLEALTGEPIIPGTLFGEQSESHFYPIEPTSWIDWLHENCALDWVIVAHREERGIRVWFADATDETTFNLVWAQIRAGKARR